MINNSNHQINGKPRTSKYQRNVKQMKINYLHCLGKCDLGNRKALHSEIITESAADKPGKTNYSRLLIFYHTCQPYVYVNIHSH